MYCLSGGWCNKTRHLHRKYSVLPGSKEEDAYSAKDTQQDRFINRDIKLNTSLLKSILSVLSLYERAAVWWRGKRQLMEGEETAVVCRAHLGSVGSPQAGGFHTTAPFLCFGFF